MNALLLLHSQSLLMVSLMVSFSLIEGYGRWTIVPYLFYLAMEFLSLRMEDYFTFDYLQPISNLILWYLTYFVQMATSSNATALSNIQSKLSSTIGSHVNQLKSKIYFSRNVTTKQEISDILDRSESLLPIKYLGVSLYSDYVNRSLCTPLLHNISTKRKS